MSFRDIPARPTADYHLMLHVSTYEVFAFRFALPEKRVTGIVGPRNRLQWQRVAIEELEYDEDPERVRWANENIQEFDLTG